LAGLATAGAVIWNAPQSGAKTREQIRDRFEGVLFDALDMRDKLSTVPSPDAKPAEPVAAAVSSIATGAGAPS
jgi:hypothetical protein